MPLGCAKRLVAVHTSAEGGEFMYHERLINPLCHLLGQRNRGGILEMGTRRLDQVYWTACSTSPARTGLRST